MRKILGVRALLCFASIIFSSSIAHAVVTLDLNSDNLLIGAKNVQIGSALFDVSFFDDTCANVFTGCNENSDFDFLTSTDATSAAQALLDQVFQDSKSLGLFDSNPALTLGCDGGERCNVLIPYEVPASSFHAIAAINAVSSADDGTTTVKALPDDDLSDKDIIFARFTQTSSVPEPGALALLAVGLMGLGVANRRRMQRK